MREVINSVLCINPCPDLLATQNNGCNRVQWLHAQLLSSLRRRSDKVNWKICLPLYASQILSRRNQSVIASNFAIRVKNRMGNLPILHSLQLCIKGQSDKQRVSQHCFTEGNLGICFPNKSSDLENTIFLNPTLKYFTRRLTERFIPLEDNNFKYSPNMRWVASCSGKKVRMKVWEIAGSVKCDIKIMFYNLDQRFSLSHSRLSRCLLLFTRFSFLHCYRSTVDSRGGGGSRTHSQIEENIKHSFCRVVLPFLTSTLTKLLRSNAND